MDEHEISNEFEFHEQWKKIRIKSDSTILVMDINTDNY